MKWTEVKQALVEFFRSFAEAFQQQPQPQLKPIPVENRPQRRPSDR